MRKRPAGRRRKFMLRAQRRSQFLVVVGVLVLVAAAAGFIGKRILVLRRQRLQRVQDLWDADVDEDSLKSSKDSSEWDGGRRGSAGAGRAKKHGGFDDTQSGQSENTASEGRNQKKLGKGAREAHASATKLERGGRGAQVLWPKPLWSGWVPHSEPIDPVHWPRPGAPSAGYLVVRCNGGLNQQRSAICDAVVVARILNATLLLPKIDTNDFWNDTSSFASLYDVDHFIRTLAPDVRVVKGLPPKTKLVRLKPPRGASLEHYTTQTAQHLAQRGAIFLSPFAHRLAEELGLTPLARELQRLRCRVNFHALRFSRTVRSVAGGILDRLREEGPFVALHLRFEKDMLAFAGCFDIFSEDERQELQAYRKKNFADKELEPTKRRHMGKCPLTPQEAALILQSMGFPNTTRVFLASGRVFSAPKFLPPLRRLFPRLANRSALATAEEEGILAGQPLLAQAVDYAICVKADLFLPTYDGPSNFANNVIGHRMYSGFVGTVRPDRKALAQLVEERANGNMDDKSLELAVRQMVYKVPLAAPYPRGFHQHHVPFLANPWPECFCKDRSQKEDALTQRAETGGFELTCPANRDADSHNDVI